MNVAGVLQEAGSTIWWASNQDASVEEDWGVLWEVVAELTDSSGELDDYLLSLEPTLPNNSVMSSAVARAPTKGAAAPCARDLDRRRAGFTGITAATVMPQRGVSPRASTAPGRETS
ncbi:unnamed protein product [Echinostoma caproni]|uniref:DUF4259 domain-containing protein n=1 Tax=Echinostoma caproni TaxID=27848 RepID=A0A183B508_9TREM|nr:unnamed protein product [Echinostoma caproni]